MCFRFGMLRASACLILACLSVVLCIQRCAPSGASACLILASVILLICMQRCGPSGMFLRSACFGMFDFGMFNYFLLSACCIPHTHTLPARCWSCSWSRGRAELRCSNAVRRRHGRCCFLHANFHHVVLFWSLWSNKKLQTTAVARIPLEHNYN